MSRVLVIGNSGFKHKVNDGQTIKTRIYIDKIKEEGNDVTFVDLEDFSRHPFSILLKIRKGINNNDRIILLAAERGAKLLIPFINKINKRRKKPFILPLIGIGILHNYIDRLSDSDKQNFISNHAYCCKPKKKDIKNLKKITYILPETELISEIYKDFFGLNNVFTLNNFRDCHFEVKKSKPQKNNFNIVFLSRIWKTKGIFDLLDVVLEINQVSKLVSLDIYGPKELDAEEENRFKIIIDSNPEIQYFGSISEDTVINTLAKYDLLVFPTRYFGEGTPGIISESLLAGTPVLTSDFPQARFLLKDGYNSVFFEMLNVKQLKEKLIELCEKPDLLAILSKNALESSKVFNYENSRHDFLLYVCGLTGD